MSDDKRISMREMQDRFNSIIDEVASACGVFGSAVEIIINRTDASDQAPPWRIRVYAESKTAKIYKQRTIDGDGATVEDAARSAIDNVVQNVLSGAIQTRNGLRSDIVSDFKDRMKEAAINNDQRSLIPMLIEINGWTAEEAMGRILKIKQYDDPNRNEKIWKTK